MRRIHRCGTLSARDEVVARLIHDQVLAFHANGAEKLVLQLVDPVLGPIHAALLLHEQLLYRLLLHLDLLCTCSTLDHGAEDGRGRSLFSLMVNPTSAALVAARGGGGTCIHGGDYLILVSLYIEHPVTPLRRVLQLAILFNQRVDQD